MSFEQARLVFDDPLHVLRDDDEHSVSEDRYVIIGSAVGRILFVSEVEIDEDTVRIISARKATHREKEEYYGNCALHLGKLPKADQRRMGAR
ncbi:hypothetical protein AGMMS49959_05640 [Planctomycetales bacterium]|nr:hypothetical protein AGMMS49959_05640 [Planctomycetales bacterium]